MIPQEKAKELVAKHFQIVAKATGHKGLKTVEDTHVFAKLEKLSKSLAQLTVLEIINSNPSAPIISLNGSFSSDIIESIEYFGQVAKEIELL